MIIDEQVFHFTADYDHRDKFGGAADIEYTGIFKINRSSMLSGKLIMADRLEFTAVHVPMVKADMLGVADAFSGLVVISEKMIEIIDSVWPESLHKIIATISPKVPRKYFVVQVPILDILDWENSEYNELLVREMPDGTRSTTSIDKYAFTVESNKLPPVFSLTAQPTQNFMRADVREALRRNDVRGIAFKKAAKFSSANQYVTDLPV